MAKKKTSNYPISGFGANWSRNPIDNRPQSGEQVQNFLNENLGNVPRAIYFDSSDNTMYFFKSAEDKALFISDPGTFANLPIFHETLNMSGMVRQVKLTNQLPSDQLNISTNMTEALVSVSYILREKGITDSSWTDTNFGGDIKVFIDRGASGQYEEIIEARQHILAEQVFTFNIRDYLISGQNRIKIQAIGEDDEHTVGTFVYNALLSEMYIEPLLLNWHTPFIENSEYNFGGFRIVGSIAKTIHIRITQASSGYSREYSKYIGTQVYNVTPFFFPHNAADEREEMFPDRGTGVYMVDAWLTAGELESSHVTYSIMCVAAEDVATAKLVVVNEKAEKAYNYNPDNHLFSYALYNCGFSTGDVRIIVRARNGVNTATTLFDQIMTTRTSSVHEFIQSLEWSIDPSNPDSSVLTFEVDYDSCVEANSIPIDNTGAYPATSGFRFYLNAANRSNAQADKTVIYNEVDHTPLAAEWNNISFIDGVDGWTVDDIGRKCLRIPAGSSVSVPVNILAGDNVTFEVCFKASNVADYNENIITIAENPASVGFHGIRIRPTEVTMHSSDDVSSANDIAQGTDFADEEDVHLLMSIARNYKGNVGKNLVTGYVNGCKAFQFDYGNVVWANDAPLVIGSQSADVFLYFARSYNQALGSENSETNFVSSLPDRQQRIAEDRLLNSILDNLHEVDYSKVKNNHYNFFVLEMKDGQTVPSMANGWSKNSAGKCDFEMHYGQHPEWDFKLYDIETTGQGTTSMDYYRWNLRWRIDKSSGKKVMVSYFDTPTTDGSGNITYNEQEATLENSVFFDGGSNGSAQQHPKVKRITAKKNQASSMQSHKIGATRAFNDLHNAVVGLNEAQALAQAQDKPLPCVAVYQYPAFGFEKKRVEGTDNYTYTFIGLFTIGPDKNDKATFGYDLLPETVISLEGTDHAPKLTTFRLPWDTEVEYSASNECLNLRTGNNPDDLEKSWDVSVCKGLDTGSAAAAPAVQAALESFFRPVYNVAYINSPFIIPVALNDDVFGGANAAEVLANINADIQTFNARRVNTVLANSDMEFWIEGEYVLYHQSKKQGAYVAGANLLGQCGITAAELNGMTLAEQNEYFKDRRRYYFLHGNINTGYEHAPASTYWDIDDAVYNYAFLVTLAASDNFAKNSYPQFLGLKWTWRNDDLDSLFDTGNQGKKQKPHYVEYDDNDGQYAYFRGNNSAFWTLIHECYAEKIQQTGKAILLAMQNIAGGANVFEGIMRFFAKYFFENAQTYFPISGYNVDAEFTYEAAWLDNVHIQATVPPLAQSNGNYFRAEYEWILRRTIYVMSLFHVGPFANGGYSDTSIGQMSVRATIPELRLQTALAFYPAVHVGASETINNDSRVMPGNDAAVFQNPSAGQDTTLYIPATDFLRSLGDLSKLRFIGGNIPRLIVSGKRLRDLKIGDTDPEEVTTNITAVIFTNTPSMENVDARNVESLSGTVDLTNCPRIRKALFGGTNATAILLINGAKIDELELPDTINALQLRNFKALDDEHLTLPQDLGNIQSLQVEGCPSVDALELLKDVYDTPTNSLRYIRVIWDEQKSVTNAFISMLADIAEHSGSGQQYRGMTLDGSPLDNEIPTIEGDIHIPGQVSENTLASLIDEATIEDIAPNLKKALSTIFRTLGIIWDPATIWISFADSEVEAICLANFDTDHDGGIKPAEAAAVTSIASLFTGNTDIETFDEFARFTGIVQVNPDFNIPSFFAGCSNLRSIVLPQSLTRINCNGKNSGFNGCASLEHIGGDLTRLTEIGNGCFLGCALLAMVVNFPNLTTLGHSAFSDSGIVRVDSLGNVITALPSSTFRRCASLTKAVLPASILIIGAYAFQNCTSLTEVDFQGATLEMPSPGSVFEGCSALTQIKNLTLVGIIGNSLFAGCSELTGTLNIGLCTRVLSAAFDGAVKLVVSDTSGLLEIGNRAFRNCHLSNVVLNNVQKFDSQALAYAVGLGTVTIDSVNNMGTNVFEYSDVENVTFTENVDLINNKLPNNTFNNCTELRTVTLPSVIIRIGDAAFTKCSSLESVDLQYIVELGSRAFYQSGLTSLTLHSGITFNGNGQFESCASLLTVDLGNIASLPQACFARCSSLTSIINAEALTNLGVQAFMECRNLVIAELNLPALSEFETGSNDISSCFLGTDIRLIRNLGVIERIPSRTFESNQFMTAAILPQSLLEIGYGAFSGCSRMISIVSRATTPPTIASYSFYGLSSLINVFVPTTSLAAYQAAANWDAHAAKMKGFFEAASLPANNSNGDYCFLTTNNSMYEWQSNTWVKII